MMAGSAAGGKPLVGSVVERHPFHGRILGGNEDLFRLSYLGTGNIGHLLGGAFLFPMTVRAGRGNIVFQMARYAGCVSGASKG